MEKFDSKGRLYVISGPSATGKGTLCRRLLQKRDIELSVSMTTRTPRKGEIDGRDYYFVDKESFKSLWEKGGFLEFAQVFDNYYGTPRAKVEESLSKGRNVLLEIDVQGALQVKQEMSESILIFILPPSIDELKNRICGRATETEEQIKKRISKSVDEISQILHYDYYIVNDDLDEAVAKLTSIIDAYDSKIYPDLAKEIINFYK